MPSGGKPSRHAAGATGTGRSSRPGRQLLEWKRLAPTVLGTHIHYGNRADWSQRILCISDLHWDNPHCDRALLKRHLDAALADDVPVIVLGDLFCAMQGKYDPRRDPSDVRPEHQTRNYLDALVDTAVDWFAPYRPVLSFVSRGNHETAIERNCQTDLIERFAVLHNHGGGHVMTGTYAGWLFLGLSVPLQVRTGTKMRQTIKVHYDHGSGGGGPVTKGVIQTNRRAVYLPDADIVMTGHIHEAWMLEVTRERVTDMGRPYLDTQTHVQLATYKEERLAGEGYHVERGRPPKPLGGWWLRLYWSAPRRRVQYQVTRTDG